MKVPEVVEVEWLDHAFTFGTERAKPAQTITIGYLVEETKEHIVVALSYVDGTPADQQLIDKRMVTNKWIVRDAHDWTYTC